RRGTPHRHPRPRGDLRAGRPPLRGDPAHAAAPAHAVGRAGRPALVDGPALRPARRDQPRAGRPRGLELVRRLADRLRDRRGHRRVAGAPGGHRPDGGAAGRRDRRERPAMRAVAAAAIAAALALAGCDGLPGKPRPSDRELLPSEVMSFAALYRANCSGCHGADGRLGGSRPLNDPLYLALVPRERLREVIARGVPGTAQPAFAASAGGTLTDAQIDAIVG